MTSPSLLHASLQPHTGTVNAQHSIFNEVHGEQNNYNFCSSNAHAARAQLEGHNVADARYNSRRRSCETGTRTSILGKASAWALDANGSSVCWLHGKAGTGKSAVAQSISRTFAESGQLAASFFFSRDDEKCSSAEYIVATIAYQLTESIPDLRRPVYNALKNDILDQQIEEQWQKLVVEPLQAVPESDYPRIIVLDALDECTHPHQLKVLPDSTSDPHFPLRFFITSRLEPHIRPIVQSEGIISSSYDLQDFVPDDDIQLFLERRLGDIRQQRDGVMPDIPSLWPTADKVATIVMKSSGLFIYASTAINFIADRSNTPQSQLEILLRDESGGFSDLDQLYRQVLSAAPTTLHDLQSVIGAILFLRNPLNLRELACCLEMSLERLMLVLEGLRSIFSIPENHNDTRPVTTFHSSLYECLTSKDRAGVFFIDAGLKHAALAMNCLNHIGIISSNVSFKFRYPSNYRSMIEDLFRLRSDVEKAVIKYACRYWSFHLSKTYRRGTPSEFAALMNNFVLRDLVAWSILLLFDAQPSMDVAREREWEQTRESEEIRERVAVTEARIRRAFIWFAIIAMTPIPVVLIVLCMMSRKGKLGSLEKRGGTLLGVVFMVWLWVLPVYRIKAVVVSELDRAHQDVKICLSQARPLIINNVRPYRIYHNTILYRALRFARRFREQPPDG